MKTRPDRADEILEFCKTPRTIKEIGELLGFTTFAWVKRIYLNYLLENGEIKMKYPQKPRMGALKQRYMTAGYEIGMLTLQAVLELCMKPHRKREIAQHFQVSVTQINEVVNPLIAEGKLVGDDNPNIVWRKFITAESEIPTDRAGQIKYYCQQPRTRHQIIEFIGLSSNRTQEVINEQVKAGNIKMLMPEKKTSTSQLFIAAEIETHALTADEVVAFCKTARTRKEIAERFRIEQRVARRYIQDLIKAGRLNYTIPELPISRQQKYIAV
jgi:predicted ArsR family transcriptional regulator